jgi:hypothetical protein
MGTSVQSVAEARVAAAKPDQYLIWVRERDASRFQEPGWVKLEPPRNGAVLFVHRGREVQAVRKSAS